MRCASCDKPAIIGQPARCKAHFIEEFECRVKDTIERYELITAGERIAVACSGGKDSLTILMLLKRWYGDVTAVAIDEGIAGYREHTLADLRRFCDAHAIPLVIRSYEEITGMPLDRIVAMGEHHPCSVCGVLRRHLLHVATKGFDVVATGHNLDDEAQTVLINLIRGNTELFHRGGPVSGQGAMGFTRRVKPLYFCTEKEVMTYAYLHGLVSHFVECPNAQAGYRRVVRDALNAYAAGNPDAKRTLVDRYLQVRAPIAPITLTVCASCGEPASKQLCNACTLVRKIRQDVE